MFEFMILQVIAIALIIIFPQIATWFPEHLQAEARKAPVERVVDDAPSLEQDTMGQDKQEEDDEKKEGDPLEKGDDKPK
jgi:hypothetical protein